MFEKNLITSSLTDAVNCAQIQKVLKSALDAADPVAAIHHHVQRVGNKLTVAERTYDLNRYNRVFIVGAGKAGLSMACGAVEILGDLVTGGVVITKHIDPELIKKVPPQIRIVQGSHPVPDEKSVESAKALLNLLSQCTQDDLVICLISGGGSALMTHPVGRITLADLQELTRLLLACGAEIGEINSLRKHLDEVKGGGLAQRAFPAELVTLILSDVIGSPLDVIASGPSVADPTTYSDALNVIHKYNLEKIAPASIMGVLESGAKGDLAETVKGGDACLERTFNAVISSNYLAAQRAVETAKAAGFNALLLTSYLRGEARQVGTVLASILKEAAVSGHPFQRPMCLVFGGETTVTLSGNGLGGRNSELALGAVQELAGLEKVMLVTLATDGEDGPTDASGAVVTGETYQKGRKLGLNPKDYLDRNDSYHYFEKVGDLLKPGPTGTNVNDLAFLFTI